MGGFEYGGSLIGGAPVVRKLQIAETCYTGQLLMTGLAAGTGGAVQIADVASEANENDQPLIGINTGCNIINDAGWSGVTGYGDTCTYDTTVAAQQANDPVGACEVETTLILPYITLVRGPIYNAAYGTALTECVITTANAAGTTLTHVGYAVTDMADDLCMSYCRSGASRGHYRVITTSTSTTVQTLTIAMPYGTAVGDVFVHASCVFGAGGLDIPATANCIDGNNDMNAYYDVFYHGVNLEETGKEFALFTINAKATNYPYAA